MSDDMHKAREEFFAQIAAMVRQGAAEHDLSIEVAFDMALDAIERGVAGVLGIEFCDCDDHTQH